MAVFRSPCVACELKGRAAMVNESSEHGLPIKGRARTGRNGRGLRSAQDDLAVASRKDRSWKKFRRTKYKTK